MKFYCSDNIPEIAKTTNLLHIQLNPKNVYYSIRNSLGIYNFYDINIENLLKEYSLFVIIHELIHVEQHAFALHDYSKYE